MSEMERLAASVSELGMMLAATAALDAGEDRDQELRRLCGAIEDRLGEMRAGTGEVRHMLIFAEGWTLTEAQRDGFRDHMRVLAGEYGLVSLRPSSRDGLVTMLDLLSDAAFEPAP